MIEILNVRNYKKILFEVIETYNLEHGYNFVSRTFLFSKMQLHNFLECNNNSIDLSISNLNKNQASILDFQQKYQSLKYCLYDEFLKYLLQVTFLFTNCKFANGEQNLYLVVSIVKSVRCITHEDYCNKLKSAHYAKC